ncbi:hypothetical protein M406DRAFT_67925 [Cryphonectria parasitica EP155]|uniref:Mitochondrial resolvase Ydc2 catalytic domain-containing protein n=1 Tax=Cryphonectria parasitica (strain ATCC 38755 / EP155) TaxID=660469 RepID=A0A9P5CNT7_CRYP1|nr:uncharacterized protein M406DRAFT_67925 [Cryphonectria parasitica EP155]KAF3765483.1 hypothetical protein M406DRAFT_67925 [Cryphonectria parasitica EP155]
MRSSSSDRNDNNNDTPKFTASQLKEVARLCGKNRSGTKAVITSRITDDLQEFRPLAPGTRVLSIDLGIRNLAYSLLEVPGNRHEISTNQTAEGGGGQRRTRKSKKESDLASSVSVTPILRAWERLALIPKTPKPIKAKAKGKTTKNKTKKDASAEHEVLGKLDPDTAGTTTITTTTAAENDAVVAAADSATTTVSIEDFSPLRLSQLAADLILTRLLTLRPDIITLEQQRFRSMGGSAVFEWTLRVNSLESMLYAVFTTLEKLGKWPGGRLEGVVARNVLEFMAVQEGGAEAASIWNKKGSMDNKKIKKDIVGRMLLAGEGVVINEEKQDEGAGGQVEAVAREYLDKWQAKGRKAKSGAEGLKKLDDLADCLLQGLAFIRWQENKRRLLDGGVEALQDQMVDE